MKKTEILRNLLEKPEIIIAPGAQSALFARLIEMQGYDVVYATGAGISNMQLGWADVGLISMYEVLETVRRMVDATNLPIIADIDTGFGNVINVHRTVQQFERAGVAGIQIEDQILPKKCGHFSGKQVISREDMVYKIKMAKDTIVDDNFTIIARTDAYAVNGYEDAIERAHAYVEAGANMIFIEAPTELGHMKDIPKYFNVPLIANMVEGGKTPLIPASELQDYGYKMVLYANATLKGAVKGLKDVLEHLQATGTTKDLEDKLITMEERNIITKLPYIKALEEKYGVINKK